MYPFKFRYNRRQFIYLSLGATALVFSSSCKQTKQSEKTTPFSASKPLHIVVVGAGISGIAAARKLQDNGFKVTVLEARDRIGGRIFTDRSLGTPIDLGAAWIHGSQGNPLTNLSQEFKIKTVPTDYDNLMIYGLNQQPIKDSEMEKIEARYEQIIKRAKTEADNREQDVSVAKAIEPFWPRKEINSQQEKLLNVFFISNIVTESGADLEQLSAWEWDEDEAFEGEDLLFPNGYDQMIQELAKGLIIEREHQVTVIEYNEKSVTIKTNQDTFKADAVIVTLPLGILKTGTVTFSPPLPQQKQRAIHRLEMGVLNKVVLKFPQRFWPAEVEMLGYLSPQPQNFSDFLNLYPLTKMPILVALCGGSFAKSLEKLSDQTVQENIITLLRRVHGNKIPQPEAIVITKWTSDPFSRGSYSYIPVGTPAKERDVLAQTVGERVFFAGEATSREYPATVHGAFLSGIRAAQQIIEQWND
jgi:monoamine oxidase